MERKQAYTNTVVLIGTIMGIILLMVLKGKNTTFFIRKYKATTCIHLVGINLPVAQILQEGSVFCLLNYY